MSWFRNRIRLSSTNERNVYGFLLGQVKQGQMPSSMKLRPDALLMRQALFVREVMTASDDEVA